MQTVKVEAVALLPSAYMCRAQSQMDPESK